MIIQNQLIANYTSLLNDCRFSTYQRNKIIAVALIAIGLASGFLLNYILKFKNKATPIKGITEPKFDISKIKKVASNIEIAKSDKKEETQEEKAIFSSLKGKIKWLSGSQSAALAIMLNEVALSQLNMKPALLSTRNLLDHQLVPFTGELGFIRNFMSGVAGEFPGFAIQYANQTSFIFNADAELKEIYGYFIGSGKYIKLENLKLCLLRLLLSGSKKSEYPKIKMHIENEILNKMQESPSLPYVQNWQSAIRWLHEDVPDPFLKNMKPISAPLKRGQLVCTKYLNDSGAIIMKFAIVAGASNNKHYNLLMNGNGFWQSIPEENIMVFDEENEQLYKKLPEMPLKTIQVKTAEWVLLSDKEKVLSILDMFDSVKPLPFSDLQKTMLKMSFPLIWGSTTVEPQTLDGLFGLPGELILDKPALLGEDIQLVFVEKKNKVLMQQAMAGLNVNVLDIELLKTNQLNK